MTTKHIDNGIIICERLQPSIRYEYHGYRHGEMGGVTELAEEELWVKYPDVIRRYSVHSAFYGSGRSD